MGNAELAQLLACGSKEVQMRVVKGQMPSQVERQQLDDLGVGQIVQLLENQNAQCGVQVLGGSCLLGS